MSNLQRLLDLYREDSRTEQIAAATKAETPSRISLTGTLGAQDSFVLTGTFLAHPHTILLVEPDKEKAAYTQNNITSLFEKKNIHFFPDSFKRPMRYEEINKTNVLQRTETVNKISTTNSLGEIIVTYPEALFEKVVAPKVLSKSRIEMKVNEELDVDFLIEVLVEYGFDRSDFVYEPGQFSIRGGIIDIFSYGNEWPYRIELFDTEVESIRMFNPTTQLSERKLSSVSIVPNINTRFTQSQKESVFKILPKETSVWIRDVENLVDKLELCFTKAEELHLKIKNLPEESEEREWLMDRAFIRPSEIIEDLEKFHIIELSERAIIQLREGQTRLGIKYNTKPQPSFNKNFPLLIDDLKSNTKKSIENYLWVSNPRQLKRFEAIFEDLEAQVKYHPILATIHEGFIDEELNIACYTDHQIFERFHKYKLRKGFTKDQALNLKLLRELRPGDFVTHLDHGVGKYSGLEKININGHIQESVRLVYKNNDLLYVSINSLHKISRFTGKEGKAPALSKLGSEAWKNLKRKTKRKVKDIAKELIKLYAARKASEGHAFPQDGYLQNELEASFIYEDTPDQFKATQEVKEDMEKKYPMDRLICGDVGFGKTEVAIRAAFKAVVDGKQVAVLVPTTILALQHHKTFNERLKNFDLNIDYINRFRSTKERRIIFENLKSGKIDIVIGTHGLLNKDVGFKDLGLLVIDEEQKFGVAAKEKLRGLKVNVDTLTLTATPIPRTLQFSLMAARDLSVIRTAPPNRQPIHTERRVFSDKLIRDAIYYEIERGGQVFFVHNRVKTIPDIMAMLNRLCPDIDIAMAHGQMESKQLETKLLNFIEGKYDVLCCTNIIETGLDIPNANTIIINNAHHFGLSDLHQLRGRVGRSNKKAFCYLFAPPLSVLTPEARKRLRTLEEFSELGSGFNIAMRDLDIRGAGNLLGGEQSGFISDIGFETYQKILEEAIQELKETEFKDLFKEQLDKESKYVRDVQIETDAEMLLPSNYVSNIQERLNLYTELDKIEEEEKLQIFKKALEDRFGDIPKPTEELFDALRLRWICRKLGFERVLLKSGKLRFFFITNPQSSYFELPVFNKIVAYINSKKDRKLTFKQSKKYLMLIKEHCDSLSEAEDFAQEIAGAVL